MSLRPRSVRSPAGVSRESSMLNTCRSSDRNTSAVTAEDVGVRVAAFLRGVYPRNAEKMLCRRFKVAPQTARGWLAGSLPQNRSLIALIDAFGAEFVSFVFEPFGKWAEVYELQSRLDSLRDEIVGLNDAYARVHAQAREESSDD